MRNFKISEIWRIANVKKNQKFEKNFREHWKIRYIGEHRKIINNMRIIKLRNWKLREFRNLNKQWKHEKLKIQKLKQWEKL